MGPLRFGHPEDKAAAIDFGRRQQQRNQLVKNAFHYFLAFVPDQNQWPTENTPLCGYPKCFKSIPLSVLQEAARLLQIHKTTAPPES